MTGGRIFYKRALDNGAARYYNRRSERIICLYYTKERGDFCENSPYKAGAYGSDAGQVLAGDPAVFSAGDPVLPFAAGVLHQRRGHRWSDADRRRGGRRQRYQFSGVHLFAVRLRRQRGLLRHHVLLCGHARRTGRAPLAGHAAAAVRRADGGADGAGAGAAGSHAGVDQRDARPPRGVHRGAHLLRHHLRRYRRARRCCSCCSPRC